MSDYRDEYEALYAKYKYDMGAMYDRLAIARKGLEHVRDSATGLMSARRIAKGALAQLKSAERGGTVTQSHRGVSADIVSSEIDRSRGNGQ